MADYQVLARKYRPQTFADLIGQAAMVRVLENAFAADRIAQAFILTGIRGTGKTTTARIIARGLNCHSAEGPTTSPCGACEACREIAEGRHVDVMEIDAASNTGVQNVRDMIIDTVAYAPSKARYKVFVIDEVHMLSTSAFNALLKTLEEPPDHVKFVFATTEIRKVPVTVLSRCQRFDLRRIEPEVMIDHLRGIAAAEGATVGDDALGLIARAAEGSVRDGLSLLDQAIAHGGGETTAEVVRAMLGLADRGRVLDLFDRIMRGDAAGALTELSGQYADGADPLAVLRDLAEITHWVSVAKVTPEAGEDPTLSPAERDRGREMAEALPMRALTRSWQMLLRALEEVATAPNAMMAAEMAVIRLTHVAELPTPGDLVQRLQSGDGANAASGSAPAPGPAPAAPQASAQTTPPRSAPPQPAAPRATSHGSSGGPAAATATAPDQALARYAGFPQLVELIRSNRDVKLLLDVEEHLRLAHYAPGRIEFEPGPGAPSDLASRLAGRLHGWTGVRWSVSVVATGGAPSIGETRRAAETDRLATARDHPLVREILAAFPDAAITVTPAGAAEAEAAVEALPEVPDEWDPFETD